MDCELACQAATCPLQRGPSSAKMEAPATWMMCSAKMKPAVRRRLTCCSCMQQREVAGVDLPG